MVQFTFVEKQLQFLHYKEIAINQDAVRIDIDYITPSILDKGEFILI